MQIGQTEQAEGIKGGLGIGVVHMGSATVEPAAATVARACASPILVKARQGRGRTGACTSSPAASTGGGDGAEGKAIFASNCQACHPGGGNSIVASLPIKGSKRLASLQLFSAFVRAPTMPDGKPGDMPPYGKDTLEDEQVGKLFSYLSTEFK